MTKRIEASIKAGGGARPDLRSLRLPLPADGESRAVVCRTAAATWRPTRHQPKSIKANEIFNSTDLPRSAKLHCAKALRAALWIADDAVGVDGCIGAVAPALSQRIDDQAAHQAADRGHEQQHLRREVGGSFVEERRFLYWCLWPITGKHDWDDADARYRLSEKWWQTTENPL